MIDLGKKVSTNYQFIKIDLGLKEYLENSGLQLIKNKSYMSIFIKNTELFLGEVNYDISSLSWNVLRSVLNVVHERLRIFIEDNCIINKKDFININGDWQLSYIVNKETKGDCISGVMGVVAKETDESNGFHLIFGGFGLSLYTGGFGDEWFKYWI